MRIGISGAQSVGKTTLLNALRSEQVFKEYAICNEVTRRVREYGFRINENGDDITQRLIMQEHIVNVFMHNNMITDRTALDGLVYTEYLFKHNKVKASTVAYAREIFKKVQPMYDLFFYIRPEFEIADDGVRSTDVEFRDEIVTIFDTALKDTPHLVLTGSVRDRVQQIMEIYNLKVKE